jgi:hypothetical protein
MSAITIHLDTNDTRSMLAYLHLMTRQALGQDIRAIGDNLSLGHIKAGITVTFLSVMQWLIHGASIQSDTMMLPFAHRIG